MGVLPERIEYSIPVEVRTIVLGGCQKAPCGDSQRYVLFFFFFKLSGAPGDLPFSPTRPSPDLPACSVLVGGRVDGPPRWIPKMPSETPTPPARPTPPFFTAIPGPKVVVIASAPAYPAQIA